MPPSGGEVGAELAELYKKGRDDLPKVEDLFDSAGGKIYAITLGVALQRDASLGLGAQGCYSEFNDALSSLKDRIGDVESQLDTVGINIMKTAQDMANVDAETSAAFKEHGGEL